MAKIVISYRRSDVPGVALLLHERLRAHFRPLYGDKAIYMDVKEGRRADDYDLRFSEALKDCSVMLVLMGQHWFGGTTDNHTKLTDADDPVRRELETASRIGIRMLPVLIDGAEMVKANKLPPALRKIRNADASQFRTDRYSDSYFTHLVEDIEALLTKVDGGLPEINRSNDQPVAPQPAPEPEQKASPAPVVEKAGLLAALRQSLAGSVQTGRSRYVVPFGALTACLVTYGVWYGLPRPAIFIPADVPSPWPQPKTPLPRPIEEGGKLERFAVTPLHLNKVRAVRSISFSNGNMAVGGDDGIIRIWDAATFRFIRGFPVLSSPAPQRPKPAIFPPRPHGVHKITFSAKGNVVYSAGLDNKVTVLDPATGAVRQQLVAEPNSNVTQFHSLAAFPNPGDETGPMRFVAAGGDDGCFRIWDIDSKPDPVWFVFSGGNKDELLKKCEGAAKSEQREIATFAYTPKGRDYYVVGNYDGTLGFVNTRFNIGVLPAHDGPVWDVVFSPTGDQIASAGGDGAIKIWDFVERKVAKVLAKFDFPVWSLAWDDQTLISGDARNFVRLWDMTNGRQSGEPFKGHEKNVVAVAFHPDKKWIVSAGEDGMVKVWERDGKSHEALLTIVAYSEERYIIIHRDGTFTGPAPEIAQEVELTYTDGPLKGRPLNEQAKLQQYRTPEAFARKLITGV